jgi:hypothetical protein
LHCRPQGSALLAAELRSVADEGDYSLTDAGLAFELARERGCFDEVRLRSLHRAIVLALRAAGAKTGSVDDLAIERLAILGFLGERLPVAMVRRVAAAQQPDGSWLDSTGKLASWHPTMPGGVGAGRRVIEGRELRS